MLVDSPGPILCFQQVPGRSRENNRIHLDIAVSDRAAEVRRLVTLGAQVVREEAAYTVMRDPEGNQFCCQAVVIPGGRRSWIGIGGRRPVTVPYLRRKVAVP